jgi:phosphotransferase system enzyme I (PtsP)
MNMAKTQKKSRKIRPHLDILEDISVLISHSHDLQETLERIVATVADRMQTEVCSIYILDRDKKTPDTARDHGVGSRVDR